MILGAKQLKIDTIFFNEHQATHEVDTVEVLHLSEIVTFFE